MGEDRFNNGGNFAGVVLGDFLKNVKTGQENAIDVVKELLVDGKEKVTLAIQNRVLQPEQVKAPERAESPKRAHSFNSINGFMAYITKYKTSDTVILADVENRIISCVLDDKAAKGFEVVSFQPKKHPLFEPWQGCIIDKTIELKQFVRFLMANKKAISTPSTDDLMMLFTQVRASTNIAVHKGVGPKSLNGMTCQIEICGNKDNQEVALPNAMRIYVPIFMDAEKAAIDIDLLLDTKDGIILVSCTSSDVAVREIEAFEGFVKKLEEVKDVVVSLGNVDHAAWAYL